MMWWLLWIPIWIGALALGLFAAHCQERNTQRMIDNTLKKTLSKPIAKPVEKPSPPNPSVRKGGQVHLESVTYQSIIVDNKEYVDIGLYRKALEAFFKASEGDRTGDRP